MAQNNSPDFATWSNENLVNFAKQANERMKEQQIAIDHLKKDLNFAMKELRKVVFLQQEIA